MTTRTYTLGMFPYPSGRPHMGHVRVYTLVDVVARHARMHGADVLNPLGWDAFGLPAENAARARGVHPADWTSANIAEMRAAFAPLGWSFDMDREFSTCDPDYYRWTQAIFLALLDAGLAYRAAAPVPWCDACGTVLAEEQVIDGACWRCDGAIERRELAQWFFRLRSRAQALWDGLDGLTGWDRRAVSTQRAWIGRREGIRIAFPRDGAEAIEVFTTRADTVFGVSALVLAPEHPAVRGLASVRAYAEAGARLSAVERQKQDVKTGVDTGMSARHPLTGQAVPVWVADYVLAGHGTGAVMCVPAHDVRDHAFAVAQGLPIRRVVDGGALPWAGEGSLVDSGAYTGMATADARDRLAVDLAEAGLGGPALAWRLKDWSVGRQRAWGCPIPVVHCARCGPVGVPVAELPVVLPRERDPAWADAACPRCAGPARRETDTLDTFVCSSWYAFRFCDPHNVTRPFARDAVGRWMPVDTYVGGLDHAAQHMLYFRFFTKVFHELGWIDFDEPVHGFVCNGMVKLDGAKMSKSRGNVVSPDAIVREHGADVLRLAVLADVPPEADIDWSDDTLVAPARFVRRLAHLGGIGPGERGDPLAFPDRELVTTVYRGLRSLDADVRAGAAHNAVARLYGVSAALRAALPGTAESRPALRRMITDFLVCCLPFVPQVAGACLARLEVANRAWPAVEPAWIARAEVPCAIQVDGRTAGVLSVSRDAGVDEVLREALASSAVQRRLAGRAIHRRIYVQGRVLNLVTAGG